MKQEFQKLFKDAPAGTKIKIYPESDFRTGKLLRDIQSKKRKGYYAKDSIIRFNPLGVYVQSGSYLCGWFKEDIQLVEGQDYILI